MTTPAPFAFGDVVELLEALTERLRYRREPDALAAWARQCSALIRRAADLARAGQKADARRLRDAIDGLTNAIDPPPKYGPLLPPAPYPAPLQQIAGATAQVLISEVRVTLDDGVLSGHEASCPLAGLSVDDALAEALRRSLELWRDALRREHARAER